MTAPLLTLKIPLNSPLSLFGISLSSPLLLLFPSYHLSTAEELICKAVERERRRKMKEGTLITHFFYFFCALYLVALPVAGSWGLESHPWQRPVSAMMGILSFLMLLSKKLPNSLSISPGCSGSSPALPDWVLPVYAFPVWCLPSTQWRTLMQKMPFICIFSA